MTKAKRTRRDPLMSLSYQALQEQFADLLAPKWDAMDFALSTKEQIVAEIRRVQASKGTPTMTKPQAKPKDPLMRLTHAKLVERYEDMLSHDEEIGDLALLTKSKLVAEIRRLEAVRPQIPVRTPPGLVKALRRASLQSGRLSASEVNAWLRTLPSSAAH